MMLQNPTVVPKTVGGDVSIKFGKAGGISTGTWWETGVKTNGNFQIARENDADKGGILLKSNGRIDIGKKFTIPQTVIHGQATTAIIPEVETSNINVTPIGTGKFVVFSPLSVVNDNSISWSKSDMSQALAIGTIGTDCGISAVGTIANQNINVLPKGTGSFIIGSSQGNNSTIGIDNNNIKVLSSLANQDINIAPKGTGSLNVSGNLNISNDLFIKGIKANNFIEFIIYPKLLSTVVSGRFISDINLTERLEITSMPIKTRVLNLYAYNTIAPPTPAAAPPPGTIDSLTNVVPAGI